MPLLELRHIVKSFGRDRPPVLEGIDLTVMEGEFVAIVGYSGSGKTTLMSLAAGLLAPDTGQVLFAGRPVIGPDPERALVFQNYALLPWLTVADNVALAVDARFPAWPRRRRAEHVDRFIEMVNLTPARHRRPAELSGGMRQRVAVARALAMDPKLLLLDEPLSALDALTRATLQDEIEAIWERDRKTVVLITNDVDEGILLADRIVPLTMGPRATLGPSIRIDLPRPRDRRALNHDSRFQRIRREVFEFLLGPGAHRDAVARAAAAGCQDPVLPDLKPADLRTAGWDGALARFRPPAGRPAVRKEAAL
jgi:nitrate/nitrite transport system ATP-binding protein